MGAGIPLTWRVLAPADRRDFSLLLDRAFGLSAPASYLADFPVWDPEIVPAGNRHQVGGFHGPRLVSTASLRFADYRFADGTDARFGLIGAVATHPDFARRGYGAEALALAIHEADRRGVGGLALWGSDSPLYRRRKFEFGGNQIRVPIASLRFEKPALAGYEFRSGWDSEIGAHFLARKSGLRYQDGDLLWLSRHPNVEWRTLWIDGKCLAYVGWNRGIDLPNLIHEIDGEPAACLVLLRLLQERYPALEWLAHPELLRRWKIEGSEVAAVEALAQFRLRTLDPARIGEIWFSGMDAC
ncbi:MAG: GNAT family N-acetyltransferase [Bdellovibrionales bacterium]|nr:GNAT family N-acetyltransferase [Bdellovibrionales bacterium]